ncbi:hypothetical protein ScPMuIL_018398 [Solemya velum]
MEYRFLGRSGLKVSNISLGSMTFGEAEGLHGLFKMPKQADEALAHTILDRFAELGGNCIDTADFYSFGQSERIVGSWLKKQDRDKFVVSSKGRISMDPSNPNKEGHSRRHILEGVDQSLERLQTDYLDVYMMLLWDYAVPIEETVRTVNDLIRCGKVRYFGASNMKGWQIQKLIDTCKYMGMEPVISLQEQYSLLERHSELEEFDVCEQEGLGVMAWGVQKGGLLTGKFKRDATPSPTKSRLGYFHKNGIPFVRWDSFKDNVEYWDLIDIMKTIGEKHGKSIAQVALRWVLQNKVVSTAVIGATSVSQLEENVAAASGWELTAAEMDQLNTKTAIEIDYPYGFMKPHIRTNPFM